MEPGFSQWCPVTGAWAQTDMQEAPSEHQKTLFHREVDGALAQAAQKGGGVSILGEIQKPPGHSAGQVALGGLEQRGWTRFLQRFPPTSAPL